MRTVMKRGLAGLSWAVLTAAAVSAGQSRGSRDVETIRRTLAWPAGGDHTLEVSNVNGSVRVVGYDGRQIEMIAERTVHAETDASANEAKRSARLDVFESPERARVCGDADRCGCDIDRSNRRWDDRSRVDVDFELRVPKNTTLRVCAINNGRVTVEGLDADFDITNVNGGVTMTNMRGSGRAATVNGDVTATFAASPKTASSFRTVNGRIEVIFPRDLSADLRLNTLHGGIYTDFDIAELPAEPPVRERRGDMFVYRANRFATVRVGRGGPVHTFEGLNGDIRVRRAK